MKPEPHPGWKYNDGCRCDDCREWARISRGKSRRRVAERSHGLVHDTTWVHPGKSQAALWDAISVRGITAIEVARVTGLQPNTVHYIRQRKGKYVTHKTEQVILRYYGPDAEPPRKLAPLSYVDAEQYVWKISCLFAQGWTIAQLQEVLQKAGRNSGFLDGHLTQQTQIRWANAKQIDWLAKTIGDRHGPSKRNANRMARRGIFPLIHYTDDGRLIRESLTKEQRAFLRQVQ